MLVYFHYVCLSCRRCAKRQPRSCYEENVALGCAQCGAEMTPVGKHFSAPKRRDDAGWRKLQWMIENGWRGGAWPVAPAMNLNQVRESLRTNRIARDARLQRAKESDSFETIKRNARWNFRRSRTARKREQRELKAQQEYQNAVLASIKATEN